MSEKPVECPLLPGVEPKVVSQTGSYWVDCGGDINFSSPFICGRTARSKAEAISAWNEWMQTVEVKRGCILDRLALGPSKGNAGAILRWGKHLDNGLWLCQLPFRFRIRRGYIALPWLTIMWGNP